MVRLAQVLGRPRHAAGRRRGGHDPDQPLHLPRRGRGEGRLGDPKALHLRERCPVLIACPTCGRLQFDMDTVVAEIEQRLEAYTEPVEVAVLGCAVNWIGEASHADFRITSAKDEGLIFAHGKPLSSASRAGRCPVRRDRQVPRPRQGPGRRAQGARGRRLAGEDRGGERRRAHPRAHRADGGGGRRER